LLSISDDLSDMESNIWLGLGIFHTSGFPLVPNDSYHTSTDGRFMKPSCWVSVVSIYIIFCLLGYFGILLGHIAMTTFLLLFENQVVQHWF